MSTFNNSCKLLPLQLLNYFNLTVKVKMEKQNKSSRINKSANFLRARSKIMMTRARKIRIPLMGKIRLIKGMSSTVLWSETIFLDKHIRDSSPILIGQGNTLTSRVQKNPAFTGKRHPGFLPRSLRYTFENL